MQGDPRFFTGQSSHGYGYDADGYNAGVGSYHTYGVPAVPSFDTNLAGTNNGYTGMPNGIELQASENCPKNFLIFDQTDNTSRIMFNPSYAQKFSNPGFNFPSAQGQGSGRIQERDDREKSLSSFRENSDDIDALLSLEDTDDDDTDDDVVSTGRTPCNYRCTSPDTACSARTSRSGKQKCSCAQDSASTGTNCERKRQRMKKMVKALRGIVPGGQQMDTPAFLDEAVRYLKSLKVEVRKLGIQNLKN